MVTTLFILLSFYNGKPIVISEPYTGPNALQNCTSVGMWLNKDYGTRAKDMFKCVPVYQQNK